MRFSAFCAFVLLAAAGVMGMAADHGKVPSLRILDAHTGAVRELGYVNYARSNPSTRDENEAQIRLERTLELCTNAQGNIEVGKRNGEICPNMKCEDRTVDVFWHVLADGKCDQGDTTIDYAQIERNIDALNDKFADTTFQFRLVGTRLTCDPYWNNRCASTEFWGEGGFAEHHAVDPARTLNIYTCDESEFCMAVGSWPCHYDESSPYNGVSIRDDAVLNQENNYLPNHDEGDLLVHAIGHYFGLLNVFANKCGEPGDYVDDTFPQRNPSLPGCPCDLNAPEDWETSCGTVDNPRNYMDFAGDSCADEFTQGQVLRMCQVRDVCRPSLGKKDKGHSCTADCLAELGDPGFTGTDKCFVDYCERGEKQILAPIAKPVDGKPGLPAFHDEMAEFEEFIPGSNNILDERQLATREARKPRKFCHRSLIPDACVDEYACSRDWCSENGECMHDYSGCEGFRMEVGCMDVCGDEWYTVNLENDYVDPVVVTTPTYLHNCYPIVSRIRDVGRNSFKVILENPGNHDEVVCDTVNYMVIERGEWEVPLYDGMPLGETECFVQASKQWANEADKCKEKQGTEAYINARFEHPVVLGQVQTYNDEHWSTFWAHGGYNEWEEVFECPAAHQLYIGMQSDDSFDRLPEMLGYVVFEKGLYWIDEDFVSNPTFNDVALNAVTDVSNGRPAFFGAGVTTASIRGVGNEPPYFYSIANEWVVPSTYTHSSTIGVDSNSDGYDDNVPVGARDLAGANLNQAQVGLASMAGSRCTDCGWPVFYWEVANDWSQLQLAIDEDQWHDKERTHGPEKVAWFLSEYKWAWPGNPCRREEIPPPMSHSTPPPGSCAANNGNIWCAAVSSWKDMAKDHKRVEDLRRAILEWDI